LLLSVVCLPLLVRDDGTAQGFTQLLLAYTLTSITTLLGLSTLWLACGTLARDIEECQVQMLAVKPIARWQIWLGKWLGIVSLDAVLLALSGAAVFGLLQWRASRLPPELQTVLRNEVLVARGSAKEQGLDQEIDSITDRELRARLEKNPLDAPKANVGEVRHQIREAVKTIYETVPPGRTSRPWRIRLGPGTARLHGQPMFLRIKFNTGESAYKGNSVTYDALFQVGMPPKSRYWQTEIPSMTAETFHEFPIPSDLFDAEGVMTVICVNPNDIALNFGIDDGVEILYREGGFAPSFIRALGIILCWMGLLAALGLASATFLSFPVAAFFSVGLLAISLSSGTLAGVVEEGTIAGWDAEKSTKGSSPLDIVVVPAFRIVLDTIHLATDFSPIDSLSTGRNVTWRQLGLAVGQIIGIMSGVAALAGVIIFTRRELASAQGTQ
jgi:ABC-type transport system involved in multi-copper enzyme maturation permease subunit